MNDEINTKKNNDNKEYLQKLSLIYKDDPNSSELNKYEKLLLKQIFDKEAKITKLLEQYKSLQEEIASKQEQSRSLDQQVIFERGQIAGVINSLLALKPDEIDINY